MIEAVLKLQLKTIRYLNIILSFASLHIFNKEYLTISNKSITNKSEKNVRICVEPLERIEYKWRQSTEVGALYLSSVLSDMHPMRIRHISHQHVGCIRNIPYAGKLVSATRDRPRPYTALEKHICIPIMSLSWIRTIAGLTLFLMFIK